MLIVMSGPSGVGKNTIIRSLLDRNNHWGFTISATTRSPRAGEVDGIHYSFMTDHMFQQAIDNNQFIEWCTVHNQSYGTLQSEVESKLTTCPVVIIEIDVQGAQKIRQTNYPQTHLFLMPPSIDILRQRLLERNTESEEQHQLRLSHAIQEMDQRTLYDYVVVNDVLTQTVNTIDNLIQRILK